MNSSYCCRTIDNAEDNPSVGSATCSDDAGTAPFSATDFAIHVDSILIVILNNFDADFIRIQLPLGRYVFIRIGPATERAGFISILIPMNVEVDQR